MPSRRSPRHRTLTAHLRRWAPAVLTAAALLPGLAGVPLAQTGATDLDPILGVPRRAIYAIKGVGDFNNVAFSVEFFEIRISRTELESSATRLCTARGLALKRVTFPPTRDEPTDMRLLGTDLMIVRCK